LLAHYRSPNYVGEETVRRHSGGWEFMRGQKLKKPTFPVKVEMVWVVDELKNICIYAYSIYAYSIYAYMHICIYAYMHICIYAYSI
jgi:hypothetical protein